MKNKKIVVFVKNAVPGKVKTRLAKTIGDQEALEVYLRLLEITKREVLKVDANKEVWYAWDIGKDDIWEEELFSKKIQIDGDLGEKMKNAFEDSFKNGCNKMVLIGSDCPTLTSKIMEEAFAKLDENDVVFGPSEDGGYYLIGMSSYKPEVLEEIDWSTERVMEQTELRAQENEIKLAKLQMLNDIDNEHDWNEYLANLD
ncbi:MAG: TIGR04282 family arsenosugar biosynthesis glycosyltransferase [Balneola sp.]